MSLGLCELRRDHIFLLWLWGVYHYVNFCVTKIWEDSISYSVNSLWPSDDIWHHRSGSLLAQVMAWCQAITWTSVEWLSSGHLSKTSWNFSSKYTKFQSRKCNWKCCLQMQNDGAILFRPRCVHNLIDPSHKSHNQTDIPQCTIL